MTSKPNSLRSLGERYLRHAADWVTAMELGMHLGITASMAANSTVCAVKDGGVERKKAKRGELSFRIVKRAVVAPAFTLDWPPGFVSVLAPPHAEARL